MQPSALESIDKYNENLTDVKEIFRKGDLRAIHKPLLKWYDNNRRILPWREDPAPYRVWVSEIMLQQTRVEAVKPYFQRFMETLPDIAALAQASEEILNHTYEYTVREDILMSLEYNSLPNAQVRALLKSPSPLADVFAAWEDRETSYMEEIWQTVTDRAREEAQKSRNTQKER